jgi:hypothetical protein
MERICAKLKLVRVRNAADFPHANLVHAFHSISLHAGRAGETERPGYKPVLDYFARLAHAVAI